MPTLVEVCAIYNLWRLLAQEAASAQVQQQSHSQPSTAAPIISRRLIWFHHIKSLAKRKHIVTWAHELGIGGYSKPGFPGVIVCEGEEPEVAEFVHRIRQLRWQAMSVRAEQRDCPDSTVGGNVAGSASEKEASGRAEQPSLAPEATLPAAKDSSLQQAHPPEGLRRFGGTFTELPERGMDELAAACQAAGLEEFFLTAMKIAR